MYGLPVHSSRYNMLSVSIFVCQELLPQVWINLAGTLCDLKEPPKEGVETFGTEKVDFLRFFVTIGHFV